MSKSTILSLVILILININAGFAGNPVSSGTPGDPETRYWAVWLVQENGELVEKERLEIPMDLMARGIAEHTNAVDAYFLRMLRAKTPNEAAISDLFRKDGADDRNLQEGQVNVYMITETSEENEAAACSLGCGISALVNYCWYSNPSCFRSGQCLTYDSCRNYIPICGLQLYTHLWCRVN